MNCTCGHDTIVKDSRNMGDGQWRKRYCKACGHTFTTLEQVCETLPGKQGKPLKDGKPVIQRPKVKRPVKAVKTVKQAKEVVQRTQSARSRMEDIRIEKEYAYD